MSSESDKSLNQAIFDFIKNSLSIDIDYSSYNRRHTIRLWLEHPETKEKHLVSCDTIDD